MFKSQWQYDSSKDEDKELGGGDVLIDTTGYIDNNSLIHQMLYNGGVHMQSRNYMYQTDEEHYNGKLEDLPEDPTRTPGFDAIDHQRLSQHVSANLQKFEDAQHTASQDGSDGTDTGNPRTTSGDDSSQAGEEAGH